MSQFEDALRETHKDLKRFTPLERTFDFDSFFSTMESKLEQGIQECFEIELRVTTAGTILVRTKPRMSSHVEFSAWSVYWPPPRQYWINDRQPTLPAFDGIPELSPLQIWPKWDRISTDLHNYYNDPIWCCDLTAKYEMNSLLQQWGDDPRQVLETPGMVRMEP